MSIKNCAYANFFICNKENYHDSTIQAKTADLKLKNCRGEKFATRKLMVVG